MGIMDEIEDLTQWSDAVDTNEVCEVCFYDEYGHSDECPMSPNNSFFDEEMEYGLQECE